MNRIQRTFVTLSHDRPSSDLGFAAAISGDTIVLGAPGAGNFKGAGYVFVKPVSGWTGMTETAQLRASNATMDDSFGQSAAISGNVVVLGAPGAVVGTNQGQGAAYVFLKPQTGWKTTSRFNAELTASDGTANDGFGLSAGVSGRTIVTGAVGNNHPGAAYVFGP